MTRTASTAAPTFTPGTRVQFKGHAPTTGTVIGEGVAMNSFAQPVPGVRVQWDDSSISLRAGFENIQARFLVAL